MKNSSRLELKIDRNLTRSNSGFEPSTASSSTRALNSSQLSSRLMKCSERKTCSGAIALDCCYGIHVGRPPSSGRRKTRPRAAGLPGRRLGRLTPTARRPYNHKSRIAGGKRRFSRYRQDCLPPAQKTTCGRLGAVHADAILTPLLKIRPAPVPPLRCRSPNLGERYI